MKKIIVLILFAFSSIHAQDIIQKGNRYYLSNTIVIKLKENVQPQMLMYKLSKKISSSINFSEFKKMFPATQLLKTSAEENLDRIYLASYSSNEDPIEFSKKISRSNLIEYAEPKYVHRVVSFVPNDSLIFFQSNLSKISAFNAWEHTKGDSSVIIAIVDTGVEWDHPDLYGNIYKTPDGKILGTDLGGLNGTPDDDPREDAPPNNQNAYHGTHVAGIASAVSNNKIGVASIGYNCSLMPVKVARSDKRDANGYPFVYYGTEGIKWAADHGAKIINCSWGSNSQSRYEQEVINYATSKGALVVAAAGNDGSLTDFFPASYKNVLSVVWNDISDIKNAKGNYGMNADVSAPGTFILSTWPKIASINNLYNSISGSSMAAPLVSGLAGLVASVFKNYSPLQIGEQIRATTDDVYQLNDPSQKYLLGKGRINAEKAVSKTNAISVRASNLKFIEKGNGNGLFDKNEIVDVKISLTNFLSPVNNLIVTVESADSSIEFTSSNPGAIINSLQTLQTDSSSFSFSFKILPTALYNHTVNFLLKFSSQNYDDYQWFNVRINPTYQTLNANKIEMSVTSKGALAFNDYPDNTEGVGFKYEGGDNLMFEGAFMYGTSENTVMDAARSVQVQSTDFNMLKPINIITNQNGDQQATTIFNDDGAAVSKLGIETKQNLFSLSQAPNDKFIIVENILTNKSESEISNLYAGYFFDWDMPSENPIADTTAYDYKYNFGYARYKDLQSLNTIVGSGLISSINYGYYPIDNAATSGDVRLFDSNEFSDREKWITLSSGIVQKDVGYADISFVVSSGPYSIKPNGILRIAFVIAADSSMSGLQKSIEQSRKKYLELISDINNDHELPNQFVLYQNYPNPFNPETTIKYSIPSVMVQQAHHDNSDVTLQQAQSDMHVTLKVYDILGREVATLVNEYQKPGIYNYPFSISNYQLSSGVYFYQLKAGNFIQTRKMVIIK
ncbi:MAG: S8 family peptidase [Ignavibacteriales bacterium]|nr:S8 family peptidase [Ignavibacteriales bacterium]